MNRRSVVRGIQLIVAITLITFGWIIYDEVHGKRADLAAGFAHLQPLWLVVAAACALQEGACGGLRMFVLGRVLDPKIKLRTAIVSEFVLMFCAGVTPGQAGAPVSQVAVLVHGGTRFVDVATAELMTGFCTVTFFLVSALVIFTLRLTGNLVVEGGAGTDALLGLSVVAFGGALVGLVLCAAYPPLLKKLVHAIAIVCRPVFRAALGVLARVRRLAPWAKGRLGKEGAIEAKLTQSVDEFHEGFRVYLKRGKRAYLTAQLITFVFFSSRFLVAYFILLALGVSTTPDRFVALGPPVVQVLLVQTLLNFALYLSPTPGASGVAEVGSTAFMSPWVRGAFVLPYLVLWRLLALVLCMFVGGLYVFRYLGTDVLEERVKAAEAERAAHDAARSQRGGEIG
ncbi:MAG TPA: flippase-like domain-containing protein [Byssovorax sp.]